MEGLSRKGAEIEVGSLREPFKETTLKSNWKRAKNNNNIAPSCRDLPSNSIRIKGIFKSFASVS